MVPFETVAKYELAPKKHVNLKIGWEQFKTNMPYALIFTAFEYLTQPTLLVLFLQP